ncbi:hypothetical protein CL631_02945 [bacterium]|jgi:hypothetical protein|nr:hypothetical protein [bacterium]MDP6659730.1 hypothetical protein [Candidatus Paceibacterota bacterium]|tara:strand:- start:1456 stop:2388 length:933 start_codon:yes stop_codon:yes gene_type:complete
MDQVQLSDRNYISAKRGAEITGYTQDYIGQLCRGAKIPCKRIGSNWYISGGDLKDYKSGKSPKLQIPSTQLPTDSSFVEEGVKYVSSKVAAEITGYAQDYIGQLARNGKIKAKQVGRQWYVAQNELVWHQESASAYNVGLKQNEAEESKMGDIIDLRYKETPKVIYHEDNRPLQPPLKKQVPQPILKEVIDIDKELKEPVSEADVLARPTAVAQKAAVELQKHSNTLPGVVARTLTLGAISIAVILASASISSIEGHTAYSQVGDRVVLNSSRVALIESLVSLVTTGNYYIGAAGETLASVLSALEQIID